MKACPLCQIIYNRYIPFLFVGKLNCYIGGKILTGFSIQMKALYVFSRLACSVEKYVSDWLI